jgi:hypothetical protein
MTRRHLRPILLAAAAVPLLFAPPVLPQQANPRAAARPRPKLEAVAETRLLMEGLLQANVRGLERNLGQRPADAETWTFARGQALLIAETGNLLLMRPPKSSGQDLWMDYAAELRERATRLAQVTAARDLDRCRQALVDLSGTCNRCHQNFRVPIRITPFSEGNRE